MIRIVGFFVLLLSAGCALGTAPADPVASSPEAPPAAATEAIVNGRLERARENVVFLFNQSGGACTASIIAPRVVLTARHCVVDNNNNPARPSRLLLYVGSNTRAFTAEYRVSEVHAAEGCREIICGDGSDLALLTLTEAAVEEPLMISREPARMLNGETVTAVGFGETPAGRSGTKYTTTTLVTGVMRGNIFVQPAICQGDSGGPVIGPDGKVWGVASFIYSPDGMTLQCGSAPGAYNSISDRLAWIDEIIEASGSCSPTGDEVCDGRDNDCNEQVDEVCTAVGGACDQNEECVGAQCEDTVAGRICTATCDPLTPLIGCPTGLYCSRTEGCDGRCIPGAPGAKADGDACTADTECASLACVDPGTGAKQCLTTCRFDGNMCLSNEACAALPDGCGACVPAGMLSSSAGRGLGEPCTMDSQCHSTHCVDDGSFQYCSNLCPDGTGCGEDFHCKASICVRGPAQPTGGVCNDNGDCANGLCAAQGSSEWCTSTCASNGDCPSGFACMAAGSVQVCAPILALPGAGCSADAECTSGLCADAGGRRICTRACGGGEVCATGFECVRAADGSGGVCAPPFTPGGDEDCSVSAPGVPSSTSGSAWLLLVGLAYVLVFASRRPRP